MWNNLKKTKQTYSYVRVGGVSAGRDAILMRTTEMTNASPSLVSFHLFLFRSLYFCSYSEDVQGGIWKDWIFSTRLYSTTWSSLPLMPIWLPQSATSLGVHTFAGHCQFLRIYGQVSFQSFLFFFEDFNAWVTLKAGHIIFFPQAGENSQGFEGLPWIMLGPATISVFKISFLFFSQICEWMDSWTIGERSPAVTFMKRYDYIPLQFDHMRNTFCEQSGG